MFEDDLLCACGCGLRVSNKKRKKGGIYYNIVHANRHKGVLSMGKKKGPYKKKKKVYPSQDVYELKMDINDRVYYNGKSKCFNYNDDDIKCVMCFENEEYVNKSCRCKPKKIYKKPKENKK